MKKLEMNQMEVIVAGDDVTTAGACIGATVGIATLALTIAAISGPVGWFAFGVIMARSAATGAALGSCVMGIMER